MLSVLTGVSVCVACGMRGPPLAPIVYIPDTVNDFEALRLEDLVYLRFTVPTENTDGSSPPDLDRVEVYALTTDPDLDPLTVPPLEDWIDTATLVATLRVDLPEVDGSESPTAEGGVGLGEEVVLVEELTPELRVPVVFESDSDDDTADDGDDVMNAPTPVLPYVAPPLPRPSRRTYLVRSVSTSGRESAPSASVEIPLGEPPSASPPASIIYTETGVHVEWLPAPGARRPLQEPVPVGSADRLSSRPIVEPLTPSTYAVYAVASVVSTDSTSFPAPLNAPTVGELSYDDPTVIFGTERCYVVRTLDVVDGLELQGRSSPATCVVPIDTFPPPPPTNLVAVASEGAVSLVWDPSLAADIAGYLVLRRTSAGATLEALTPAPIGGTSYRDEDVTPDERYVYAVQALDNATPPNVSGVSLEVTEQAR